MSGTKNWSPIRLQGMQRDNLNQHNFNFFTSPNFTVLYITLLVFRITENMEKIQDKRFSKCHMFVAIYETLLAS